MPTEPEPTKPTEPKPAPGSDAEADEIAAEDYDMPGQNQDAGLTLTGDEWAELEAASDERIAQRARESLATENESPGP